MSTPTVTYATLLNLLAADTGVQRTATGTITVNADDVWHSRACLFLNRALRWIWKLDDPKFAWPCTLTSSSSVTVTDGVVAWSAVGSSDWASFWQSDPRVAPSTIIPPIPFPPCGWSVLPVPMKWDGTQFNVQDSTVTSPIFAFYRDTCPQGTFVVAASNPTYATPTVPLFFQDPVVKYAAADYFSSIRAFDAANDARNEAYRWLATQKAGILNTDAALPWAGNVITT